MPVVRKEVKTYREVLICDKCGGEMKPTGFVKTSIPPKYDRRRSKQGCDFVETITGFSYPRMVYVSNDV